MVRGWAQLHLLTQSHLDSSWHWVNRLHSVYDAERLTQHAQAGGGPLREVREPSALSTIVGAYRESYEGGAGAKGSAGVCVLLTATTTPSVDLRKTPYGAGQQRNAHERQQMYEGVLAHWLKICPPLPIMLVENSGDDLSWANVAVRKLKLNATERAARLELHPLARAARCTMDEIGCHEADAMLRAVRASRLIGRGAGPSGEQQCSHVLKVTGRYAISNVHAALRRCGPRWDVAVQNTSWNGGPGTKVFGFRAELDEALFGWSQLRGQCQECHVHEWLRQNPEARVCQLPRLRVKPVTEGSTGLPVSHVR